MANTILSKAYQATKATNVILGKAGGKMLKTSFKTAKKIALLYKDAGVETYKIGKKVVKTTLKLTIDNQKELIETSGKAVKEVAQNFRPEEKPSKVTKPRKSKTRKSRKKELSIDDLLPEQ